MKDICIVDIDCVGRIWQIQKFVKNLECTEIGSAGKRQDHSILVNALIVFMTLSVCAYMRTVRLLIGVHMLV